MFSDEGVGVHLCKALEKNYKFNSDSHTISFIDGGTLANFLMYIMVEYDYIVLLDCIDADDGAVGDVYSFDYEVMPKMINWSGSAHEVEMLQTLQMLDLAGDRPKTQIIGVVPKRIEPMSFKLSDEMKKAAVVMEKTVINHIKELGFKVEKVADFSVQDMADEFSKAGYDSSI
ncbi:twin arginine translocation system, TatA/E family protein [Campylobacter geochelonis]|nr:twin arginine translocation system, TatA/E family protein [Campylobacter geochelonis]